MKVELLIQNGSKVYIPITEEGITWSTERKGSPGELKFNVVTDGVINFQEGNAVRMKVDDKNIFYGFVFTKKRDKEGIISVTAYDQLRYLKNKETYVYTNKTAGEFIQMITADFAMQAGTIEDTGFKIASRVESNTTLFDMVQTSLDLTLQSKKEMYVMYDDFGKIALKNIASMQLNIVIDEETGENFSYTSSIDSATYNVIKLVYGDKNHTKVVFAPPVTFANGKQVLSETQKQWGLLQLFEKDENIINSAQAQAKADALLSLYNRKTRNLSISNAIGDTRVRAGCMIVVMLNLGDVKIKNLMLVEKCKHIFKESEHFMDITLRGGDFVA